jgi:hypothetical protein
MNRPNDRKASAKFWRDADAYIKRLPEPDRRRLPVIRPGSAGWDEWLGYFQHIGFVPIVMWKTWRGEIDKPREGCTMPAALPEHFDLTYTG